MKRREVLKAAAAGALAVTVGKNLAYAKEYYPVQVDENLFKGINRSEEGNESGLAQSHAPFIKAPEKVKAGEMFQVDVSIGKKLHPMGPEHWIENMQINIGNEPAGALSFQPNGMIKPQGSFSLALGENLKGKTVSIVVQDQCNLHGIWESYVNVQVV